MTDIFDALLTSANNPVGELRATRVIGIDGMSGAGKTSFANVLADQLTVRTGERPQIVHMDDLYPGWSGLAAAVELVVSHVLGPLSRGVGGAFRRWDWTLGARAEVVSVPVSEWIILEGVGSGSRICRPHLSALAWLEADREIRKARGLQRDGESFRPHWESWALQEEQLFAAEDTRAHATAILET